ISSRTRGITGDRSCWWPGPSGSGCQGKSRRACGSGRSVRPRPRPPAVRASIRNKRGLEHEFISAPPRKREPLVVSPVPTTAVPWPKGKVRSPPEFLATRATTWQADVRRLRDLIARFADRGPAAAWPASRVFGHTSGRSWGVMLYKHLDHHLRQFGA